MNYLDYAIRAESKKYNINGEKSQQHSCAERTLREKHDHPSTNAARAH
jgi:hypothetical protein